MTRTRLRRRTDAAVRSSLFVYDADCGFCTKSARWLERHFRDDSASIASWQSLDLAAFDLTEADVTTAAWWVDDDGENYGAHRSIARAMRSCGAGIAWVGAVIDHPPVGWVAAPVYRWIARNRNQMPGGTDSCAI